MSRLMRLMQRRRPVGAAAMSSARDDGLGHRGLVTVGEPIMRVSGRLELGDDVTIVSQPEPTHLAVAADAVMKLADRVHVGHGVALSAHVAVRIGSRTRVGAYAMIADSDFHVLGDDHAAPVPKPIFVGDDVVIGAHAMLMPGVTIGDGAVVAPGSVVSGNVAAGATVAGNPAVTASTSNAAHERRTVAQLVADVFDLSAPPPASTVPDAVPGWDSLGTLRLMIALEREFSLRLDEAVVGGFATIGEWEDHIAAATSSVFTAR